MAPCILRDTDRLSEVLTGLITGAIVLKRRSVSVRLHGATSQKTAILLCLEISAQRFVKKERKIE
jgi:hypothetical protein